MERFSSPLIIEPPIDQTLSSKNCIAWISHSLTFWWSAHKQLSLLGKGNS